jgi:trehalose 6-phosphate phosphatase
MGTSLLDPLRREPRAAAVLLDVDGTLAPIAADPAAARVPDETRAVVRDLRDAFGLVACISGRAEEDAARVLGVPGIAIVGEHGLGLAPDATAWAERVHAFADRLEVPVERKRLSLSLHYRGAADETAALDALGAIAAAAEGEGLVPRWGRKVLEIRPPVQADKGVAVRALLARAGLRHALYAGDDDTDLDAFAALDGLPVAVRVAVASTEGPLALRRAADLVVGGPAALGDLLRLLAVPF